MVFHLLTPQEMLKLLELAHLEDVPVGKWLVESGKKVDQPRVIFSGRARLKAQGKGKANTLALVGKTNVLTYVYDLWERAFHEMGEKEYPDVKREYYHVDATCMWMVKNPEWFDVIVVSNLFGDIITDLGAMVQGGMGIASSGNIHPGRVSMFEPVHGSAPKYAGKNTANPLATIMAVSLMLDHLGETEAAQEVETAIGELLSSRVIDSLDAKSGLSTSRIGDMVAERVAAGVPAAQG